MSRRLFATPSNDGRNARQHAHLWRFPARPIRVLLIALSVGLIGFGWSQRGIFFRVAQVAKLYEQPDDPALSGPVNEIDASVAWRFIPDGSEIVASFDIPGTGAKIRLSIRKNTDAALPASHVIEVVTSAPPNFADKAIRSIGDPVLKPTPHGSGLPLHATVADVADGVFWIVLSSVPSDVTYNLRLMGIASFLDLPLVYKSGQHATLTFEKGPSGQAVFEKALTAWTR